MSMSMYNTPALPANFGPQMPQTPRTPMTGQPLPIPVPPFQFQGDGGMVMPFPPDFWPVYMGGPNGPPHPPQYAPVQPGPMFIGYPGPPSPTGLTMDSPAPTSGPLQNHTSVGPMSTPPTASPFTGSQILMLMGVVSLNAEPRLPPYLSSHPPASPSEPDSNSTSGPDRPPAPLHRCTSPRRRATILPLHKNPYLQ